eukprot:scaffold114_cov37-Prasinocladus_malaysianus.AAC.1
MTSIFSYALKRIQKQWSGTKLDPMFVERIRCEIDALYTLWRHAFVIRGAPEYRKEAWGAPGCQDCQADPENACAVPCCGHHTPRHQA